MPDIQIDPVKFGATLKMLRERSGKRPADCAYLAGVSRQYWNKLESGRVADPRWSTICKIVQAVDGRFEELIIE